MNKRTPMLTVDRRDKKCGVTTRTCSNGEPEYVVYQGVVSADVVAHFFDERDAQKYVDWRNHVSEIDR